MIKLFMRSIRELFKLSPWALPLQILNGAVKSVKPFINIILTARIVGELLGGRDAGTLTLFAGLAIGLNFGAYLIQSFLGSLAEITNYPRLYMREYQKAAMKLYSVDYQKLEDKEFDGKARKYKESVNAIGSHFGYLAWAIGGFLFGLVSIVAAVVVLSPFLRGAFDFSKTGASFIESPYLGFLVFGVMAVLIAIVFFVNKKTQKYWFQQKDQYLNLSKIFEYYLETVSDYKNGKEIRVFNEQRLIERDAAYHLIEKGVKIRKKVATATGMSSSVIAVVGAIAGFGVYAFIGLKGMIGMFEIDALIMYTGSFMIVVTGLIEVFTRAGCFVEILQTVGYYFAITDTENQPCGTRDLRGIDTKNLVAEFKNVSFKYPGSESYALKDFSIKIDGRERLAIVGHNGSGKTTFIKLLTKMYDGYEGEIFLNGINIRDFDTDEYRKLFSVVFQDFKIFSFRVSDNLACDTECDAARADTVLDGAGLKERVLRMPKGTDTYLYKDCEEDGVEISGGEAQKLALARALYKNAPFVILDEPTASLDPVAEYELYTKFNGLVAEKSAVYISHRLSSCRFCGKIAVFDKGRLVQYGAHNELMADENGKYYELWQAQAQYYIF